MKLCNFCSKLKPDDHFLKINRPGWKCRYCDECARENMARYSLAMSKVRDIEKMARNAKL